MNTEITDKDKLEGWVLYDADCTICTNLARHFQNVLSHRQFELLPLQTPWIRNRLGLAETELLAEMRLLKPDGRQFGGVDALLEISRRFWWAWPLRQMAKVPAAGKLLRLCYRWIASHRPCAHGACTTHVAGTKGTGRVADLLTLLIFPWLALAARTHVAPWVFMWVMAAAIYAGCKWLTYRTANKSGVRPNLRRTLGYLLAWPGMEAADFLESERIQTKPRLIEWAWAWLKTGFGALLLWGVVPALPHTYPLLSGWVGMIGILFVLHFGLFHLSSLGWRQTGVKAAPVMQNPAGAASLAEFWGRRWNSAFNELAFRFAYRPLRRRTTPAIATILVFGLSGLIHELVISLPAHGGFGLPTGYFSIQGLGVILERSRLGRQIGLGQGLPGRIFVLALTALPAYWLFHPLFVRNVILPMLQALGAT